MYWTLSRKLWPVGVALLAFCLFLLVFPFNLTAQSLPANPGDVVINEVAWGGTAASSADEWIELYNTTAQPITLTGWSLISLDGTPVISLTGVIPPDGYFLLERSDEGTISDVPADLIYTGALDNGGESLQLLAPDGTLIDTANLAAGPWPAGSGGPDYYSMERVDPLAPDSAINWASNNGTVRNGSDADGTPLNGTPGQPNSAGGVPPVPIVIDEPIYEGEVVVTGQAMPGATLRLLDIDDPSGTIDLETTADGGGAFTFDLSGVAPDGLTVDHTVVVQGYGLEAFVTVQPLPPTAETISVEPSCQDTSGLSSIIVTGFNWPLDRGNILIYWDGALLSEFVPASSDWEETLTILVLEGEHTILVETERSNQAYNASATYAVPCPPLPPPPKLLISEFLYDGTIPSTSGDEFVEVCNAEVEPVDLTGFKVGDEETPGGGEGMYYLPEGRILAPEECLVIAKNAAQFAVRFGFYPDYELVVSGSSYADTLTVPNLARDTAWGSGGWALADDGDELLVLDPTDRLVDSVAYRNGDYVAAGVTPDARAPEPDSLQRIWPYDTNSMPADFVRKGPNPGTVTPLPAAPPSSPPPADLPGGMRAYWGILHTHSSYSDGAGPPMLAFAAARTHGLHFLALADHSNQLTADEWADTGAQAAVASSPGEFVALRGYEYTHTADGHVTVLNAGAFVSRDDAAYDTLPEFYAWLASQPDALAEFNHPFAASDFYDFAYDVGSAPYLALLEVGNGSELYTQYHTFEGQWMQALAAGWQVAPANNSDTENAYWGADTAHRTGLVAPALTETDLLEALRARRAFATEDSNLALTLRSGGIWMGSVISNASTLTFTVDALDLDATGEPISLVLYDRTLPVSSATFAAPPVEWTVAIPGQPGHFYWARAVQADGDVAQTAPLWTDGVPLPEAVVLNEILPAPIDVDWDGDGTADYRDEWLELYNAGGVGVGLGGWQVGDASGSTHVIPLGITLAPGDWLVLYRRQTGLALNNENETVYLHRPDGTMADSYQYADGPGYDTSLCRLPDGSGGWQDRCDPTPGGPNRALPVASPAEVSIFEARRMAWDSWVKLRGHITVPPGIFSERTAYLQDETGGIKLYLPEDHRLWSNPGDRWEVTGHTQMYYGELEIEVSERQDVRTLGPGDPLPPLPIGTGVMVEPYEGTLVLLSGWAVDFERGGHFWIDDGTGWARIYLDRDAGITRPWLEEGQPLQVVGVVSQYIGQNPAIGGYRLMPRYPFDLLIQQPGLVWPKVLPETGCR
ncbi:MAG: lamin tail domain-containing protein [Anaerolineales bacterium]|nr:MAG: lamin tail domain-containing protein [Anaerolineales bacterium]